MKPSLQFRLSQHLTLTPQLQQSIRLLQLSTVELNQEIDRLLMENPALEREDHDEGGESAAPAPTPVAGSGSTTAPAEPAPAETDWSADIASNWRGEGGGDEDDGDRNFGTADTPTLRDHLRAQLSLTNLSERDRALVETLIDALDEDGYLTQPLEEIAALFPPEAELEAEELAIALRHLQNLEPAGVGARSLGECLCLQIKTREKDAVCSLAMQIAEKHLEQFRDYTRLKSATGANEDDLREAQRLIQALNPRPGAAFARVEA